MMRNALSYYFIMLSLICSASLLLKLPSFYFRAFIPFLILTLAACLIADILNVLLIVTMITTITIIIPLLIFSSNARL